jgi:hypothetical protein
VTVNLTHITSIRPCTVISSDGRGHPPDRYDGTRLVHEDDGYIDVREDYAWVLQGIAVIVEEGSGLKFWRTDPKPIEAVTA